MVVKGIVKDGVVIPEDTDALPEGADVRIEIIQQADTSLYEALKPFIGSIDGLPEDYALNHAHYIHGTPKK